MDKVYTQSFQDFAGSLGPMDLALWAGAALVLWVLFGDRLGGLKNLLSGLVSNLKNKVPTTVSTNIVQNNDVFFQLVASWKKTRDLAVQSGCVEAVKVADQMFPFISPTACEQKEKV